MSHPRIPKDLIQDFNKLAQALPSGTDPSPSSTSFSSLMQNGHVAQNPQAQAISPFDLAKTNVKPNAVQNSQALLSQLQLAQTTMANIQNQMNHPQLKLKSSQKYLIKNKLSSASSNLQAVNQRIGNVFDEEEETSNSSKGQQSLSNEEMEKAAQKNTGPLAQFLDYVSDGMFQLEDAKKQVGELGKKGSALNAADFLYVQLKITKAQQELEFTSGLLAKAVEGFKMIMNVQI